MIKDIDIVVSPREAADENLLRNTCATKAGISLSDISGFRILKKSIDARNRNIKFNVRVRFWIGEKPEFQTTVTYKDASKKYRVIIVGAGPAGLFAALRLLEAGITPVILERGNDVSARKKDVALLNRGAVFNPESNYCFGEGGAGTFSDGKLYTRSNKRGNVGKILDIFHMNGAGDEILYESHPHIGTDKLPRVIKNMRETIQKFGGEIHFNAKVTDFIIKNNTALGVITNGSQEWTGDAVILATGHSAGDIYEKIHEKGIRIEFKPFAMGIRIEHPQDIIDNIQYHNNYEPEYLPAAQYSLVEQVDNRGVFSFCMCPGGYIVPAQTAENELVVNGMSPSKRNSPFANSGIVTEVTLDDLTEYSLHGEMAGYFFRKDVEIMAFHNGGRGWMAPAQRMTDFVKGRLSSDLPDCSYFPGVVSSPLHFWLPDFVSKRLQKAFVLFDKKMKGYYTNEAIAVAPESRSSSPVRIPRNNETLEHVQVKNLFPCGEGAGYAGGIVSSAMDGEKIAEVIIQKLQ